MQDIPGDAGSDEIQGSGGPSVWGFEQRPADNCVMRLITNGVLEMAVVVHVDDIFSVGNKARCEQFGRDLNQHFPVKFLGDLEMYAGIRFTRDSVSGNLTLSQKTFAENLVKKFGVTRNKATPAHACIAGRG